MKALVVQSYRTVNVPGWIDTCMSTVRKWAVKASFEYEFLGDELFDLVPNWYRKKAGSLYTVTTDLARLILMNQRLSSGYDLCVWFDADVLVFNEELVIDKGVDYGFSNEVWMWIEPGGAIGHDYRVNNSVCCFSRASLGVLSSYVNECLTTIKRSLHIEFADASTSLLSAKHRESGLPLLGNVGLLPPAVLQAIANDDTAVTSECVRLYGEPLYAANLCHSFRQGLHEERVADAVFLKAISKLLATRGGILNGSLAVAAR